MNKLYLHLTNSSDIITISILKSKNELILTRDCIESTLIPNLIILFGKLSSLENYNIIHFVKDDDLSYKIVHSINNFLDDSTPNNNSIVYFFPKTNTLVIKNESYLFKLIDFDLVGYMQFKKCF
jgi:hypothetical protein